MQILAFMENLRHIFAEKGVLEYPVFPISLINSWGHPDFLLAMYRKTRISGFVFQPMQADITAFEDVTVKAADLLWLMNAGVADFSVVATNFLAALQENLVPGRKESAFALVADLAFVPVYGERGAFWKILFDGVACGRLALYSEILAEPLPEPIPVMRLELSRLQYFLSPERFNSLPCWGSDIQMQNFVSLSAWQSCQIDNLPEFNARIELLDTDAKSGPEALLCEYLRLYNSSRKLFENNSEVFRRLSRSLKKTIGDISVKTPVASSSATVGSKNV